jgi:outer membrane protein OmpA-like peptidoglycan-associated protein
MFGFNQTRSLAAVLLLSTAAWQAPAQAQTTLTTTDLVRSLVGLETTANVDVAALRRAAEERARQPDGSAVGRPPIAQHLYNLPQLTLQIEFNFDSAIIKPSSYPALGRIADTLYHPYLLGYRFLVVGHTDAKGRRDYNLKLSQERADAIREALVTTFRIAPQRLLAVGLGEEQLQDAKNPDAAVNRRVQIVTTGKAN